MRVTVGVRVRVRDCPHPNLTPSSNPNQGPLGAATGCDEWRWWQVPAHLHPNPNSDPDPNPNPNPNPNPDQVQADGRSQSAQRPTPRFHHSQTVLGGGADRSGRLAVCGGCDYTMSPLLGLATLSLQHADLAPAQDPAAAQEDGAPPGAPPALSQVVWEAHEPDDAADDAAASPPPLERHAAASWDAHGLIVVGGEDAGGDLLRAAWLYLTAGGAWLPLPDLPHERSRVAAVVVKGEQLVVCGGMGGGSALAVRGRGRGRARVGVRVRLTLTLAQARRRPGSRVGPRPAPWVRSLLPGWRTQRRQLGGALAAPRA